MRFRELKSINDDELLRLIHEKKISPIDACLLQLYRGWLNWPEKTGQDLMHFRKRHNLTQTELALLLKVTPAAIGRWEHLEKLPSNISILLTSLESQNFMQTLENGNVHAFFETKETSPLPRCEYSFQSPTSNPPINSLTGKKGSNPLPPTYQSMTAQDIRNLRENLRLSRKAFAQLLNVTTNTIDKWETEATTPSGTAVVLLNILLNNKNKSKFED